MAFAAVAERRRLVDELVEVRQLRKRWEDEAEFCSKALGGAWRSERTEFDSLYSLAAWAAGLLKVDFSFHAKGLLALASDGSRLSRCLEGIERLASTGKGLVDKVAHLLDWDPRSLGATEVNDVKLRALVAWLAALASEPQAYEQWVHLIRLEGAIVSSGFAELVARVRSGTFTGEQAVTELRFARAERLWKDALQRHPILRAEGTDGRQELANTFARLDRERLITTAKDVLRHHLLNVPQGALGEMKVVRGEIGKRQAHIPLRKLFKLAGTAVQRTKPVLLMSPLSVAQYLPPDGPRFDLLVIDEASQVRPEDALGAIARAKQVVVVGDQRQLPPSSFF